MKKYIISAVIVLAFVAYALKGHFGSSNSTTIQGTNDQSSSDSLGSTSAESESTNPNTGGNTPNPTPTPIPTPSPRSSGQYKNGSYTGSLEDAFYGPLQVKAVISGGKLTDVVFLQYPNDQQNSIRVNSMAIPMLKQEAISAQSANVDIVSGATQSSEAFRQSLGAALLQARS